LVEKAIITLSKVSKKYREIEALREISLTINEGEIFGYIGPNGAGKTTTLKILVGLIQDYTGIVKIKNKELNEKSKVNQFIGYLPQEVGFQEWRTVEHALTTFGLLSGMPKEQLENRITEVLTVVRLQDARNRKIKHLSGGMVQRLKLAQALLHNPPILILDEPLSGLDPTSRWEMKRIIRKLAETNVTIIFSSHILEDVEGIATKIGIINRGNIVKVGTPQELQKETVGGEVIEVTGTNLVSRIQELQTLAVVAKVTVFDEKRNRLSILITPNVEVDKAILELMDFFVSNEIVIREFNYLKPSLERVYMKYVQEEARV
jgi:ABC-2 type transport system ATP-binding protein